MSNYLFLETEPHMSNNLEITISCASSLTCQQEKAVDLAQQLDLPLTTPSKTIDCYQLVYTDIRLELQGPSTEKQKKRWLLYTDFIGGNSGYRRIHNKTIKQPLARAVGIKPGFRPTIVDATTGMGNDGFVFACLGCKVTLIERSPVMAAILSDGIDRAYANRETKNIVKDNMRLLIGDAQEIIKDLSPPPHTIYLDPMYPHTNKSALKKKEMRMIRLIVGNDHDADILFNSALKYAANRVVVKRPRGAKTITSLSPSHQIEMKNSRFDVYMVNYL